MRKRARTDANHRQIVEFFRSAGASVLDLSRVGDGCPDLLVGYQHQTALVEIKDGSKAPSKQQHTELQLLFMRMWRGGPVSTIRDIEGAQTLLRALSN